MLKILEAPNSVLSEKAKPVVKIDKEIQNLIEEMKKTLDNAKDPEGVGLAAPQIGKSLQIFIAKESKKHPFKVFINPVIIQNQSEQNTEQNGKVKIKKGAKQLEGCLSLPSIWGNVKRKKSIIISYYDETGKFFTRKVSGFLSTIIQHEMDHLNGILFPKRALEQKETLYKSKKNEKGEDVFEEIEL